MAQRFPPQARRPEANHNTDISTVVEALDKRQDQFLSLLGSPEAVARFRTVALHAVTTRPDLLKCEPLSIVEAIREAATLDLEPTGILGEAWLIPYKGMAKLRIGWQGHLKLIRNAGIVAAIDTQVVYEADVFEIAFHLTPPFRHLPALKDRGGYRGAYAWARMPDGTYIFEWLPVEDVAPIRAIAAADSLMWEKFPGEGMRKSAIRRLQKRLPKSNRIDHALKLEAETEEYPTVSVSSPARSAALAAVNARFDHQDGGTTPPTETGVSSADGSPTEREPERSEEGNG